MRTSLVLVVVLMAGYAASEASKCSSCVKGKSSTEEHPTNESVREKRQYNNGYYGSYSNYYSYPQQYSYGTQQRSSCLMQSLLNHKIFCARKKRDVGSPSVDKADRQAEVETALDKARSSMSVDLVAAAKTELRQLELFEKHPELLNEEAVSNAIRRYESCWLPMKPDVNMTAPLDVMLVWHAHMLRPSAYVEDSSRLAGDVVDHAYATKDGSNIEQTISRWQSVCPGEPFEWQNTGSIIKNYKPSSSYEIAAAVKRQRKFAKKILALNMTSEDIHLAVEQYMKFLAIATAYPDLAIAPTLEMDLAWHAHQVHPLAYARDTEAITGDLVDHVDEIDEDEPVELPTDLFAKHFGGSQSVEKVDRQAEVEKALDKARNLVSIDLVAAANAELRQLEAFEKHPELLTERAVSNAIRRYETCWLLMKPDMNMRAPLDVMLVWHAHMLRPSAYSEDSSRLAGIVVDHAYAPKNGSNLEQTIRLWRSICPGEPFESLNVGPVPDYTSQSSYDLASAIKRQRKFAKKILALNMTSEGIHRAVEQYMKFLAIASAYPDLAIAPTLEMDLAWHAHQVHPLAYARDTEAITGDLVDHVDEIDEDEPVELPTDLFAKHFGGAL